jgi:hypothetical protein
VPVVSSHFLLNMLYIRSSAFKRRCSGLHPRATTCSSAVELGAA